MTQDSVAIPAKQYYAKRTRHYLAERGLDEQVLATVSIQPAGQAQVTFNRSVGGAIGAVAGDVLSGGGQDSGMLSTIGGKVGRNMASDVDGSRKAPVGRTAGADVELPKNGVLVLTSGRLLVFSKAAMGLFSGKPKAAHADIPLLEVESVSDLVQTSVAGMKSVQLAVILRSGSILRMEFPPVAVQNGTALVSELVRRVRADEV